MCFYICNYCNSKAVSISDKLYVALSSKCAIHMVQLS
nr:MAG TPA: hypothetical protein [Caudoviricetes sp.]